MFPTVRYWPAVVTTEAYANGGTVLSGTPVYGWIAASPRALENLCIYLPRTGAAGANEADVWFRDIAARVSFFDEPHYREFQACSGAKVVVDRRFSVDSCESTKCPPEIYRVRSCLGQEILYYSDRFGALKSRVCLP